MLAIKLSESPDRTVYVAGWVGVALRAMAGFAAERIAEASRAVLTPRELAAGAARWLTGRADPDPGITCADKAAAATNPSRAGTATIGSRLEIPNCACFKRWRPNGLLLAKFALTGKAGRGTRCFRPSPAPSERLI